MFPREAWWLSGCHTCCGLFCPLHLICQHEEIYIKKMYLKRFNEKWLTRMPRPFLTSPLSSIRNICPLPRVRFGLLLGMAKCLRAQPQIENVLHKKKKETNIRT